MQKTNTATKTTGHDQMATGGGHEHKYQLVYMSAHNPNSLEVCGQCGAGRMYNWRSHRYIQEGENGEGADF